MRFASAKAGYWSPLVPFVVDCKDVAAHRKAGDLEAGHPYDPLNQAGPDDNHHHSRDEAAADHYGRLASCSCRAAAEVDHKPNVG